MGVIQNSLNQSLVTVMGGIVGMKHIQGQQEATKQAEIKELTNLKEQLPKIEADIEAADKQRIELESDKSKYEQGQFKAYVPGDTENPIWVPNTGNEDSWSLQKEMTITGLKSAINEIESKGERHLLMQNRIKELEGKYPNYLEDAGKAVYGPSKKEQKELDKQNKENIKKGVF